jgi:hypothetical protein
VLYLSQEKEKENKTMNDYKEFNYWFTDNESGENFFVMADCNRVAWAIARENFGRNIVGHGKVSEEWAEMQGWDTY